MSWFAARTAGILAAATLLTSTAWAAEPPAATEAAKVERDEQGTTLPIEDPVRKPVPRPDGKGSAVVLAFESNDKDGEAQARAFEELLTTRISKEPGARVLGPDQARYALGPEKQKLLACADGDCLTEFCDALGVRYLLRARLDHFGAKYVLTTAVVDSRDPLSVVRSRVDIESEDALLAAADRAADEVAGAIGLARPEVAAKKANPDEPWAHANLKFGHMLPLGGTFDWRTFKFEVEGDYYLAQNLPLYFEVGFVLGRADSTDGQTGSFKLVPLTLGLKYVFLPDWQVRPYVGLGLGLAFLQQVVDPGAKIGLHFNGLMGVAYMPWKHLGFNLETTFAFDSVTLSKGSTLDSTFTYNFGVIALY